MPGRKPKNLDPLYQLFEHFLLTRSYEDSAAFTKQLAEQYVAYLDSTPAHVPFHCRQNLMEDLEHEAHEMLVKKMYGVVRANDYENTGKVIHVKPTETFGSFDFAAPLSPEESSDKNE